MNPKRLALTELDEKRLVATVSSKSELCALFSPHLTRAKNGDFPVGSIGKMRILLLVLIPDETDHLFNRRIFIF